MWKCPLCNQQFIRNNQVHSCRDKVLADFLKGKSSHTLSLFETFIQRYQQLGLITVHPTKSMIAIASTTRIAYITQLGKDFLDVVFPFGKPYEDNLCFRKIAQVPGTKQYNHHLRLLHHDDINEEVLSFMKLAMDKLS